MTDPRHMDTERVNNEMADRKKNCIAYLLNKMNGSHYIFPLLVVAYYYFYYLNEA